MNNITARIRACRHCESATPPLPHQARPVIQGHATSKIRIIGQAPGLRVHKSGRPFTDPSGDRLRTWLGVNETQFYNPDVFAITPMGFCFPGYDKKGSDLPPRKECAALWHDEVNTVFRGAELTLIIGQYAQAHYLQKTAKRTLTLTVEHWREYGPTCIPLPHPSWRNNGWLKRYDWFEDVLDHLRQRVSEIVL